MAAPFSPPITYSLAADAPLPLQLDLLNLAPGFLEIPVVLTGLPLGAAVQGAEFTAELAGTTDPTDTASTTVHHAITPSDATAEGIRSPDTTGAVVLLFQLTTAEAVKLASAHVYDVRVDVLHVGDTVAKQKQIMVGVIATLPLHANTLPPLPTLPTFSLEFSPLQRRSDLARPRVYASYPNAIPQHIGTGLLNTGGGNARMVFPRGGGKWGMVPVTQNQAAQADSPPDAHNAASTTQVPGRYPDTVGWSIAPRADIPEQHYAIHDASWRPLSAADNGDLTLFKRSIALSLKARTPADIGKKVVCWLADQSVLAPTYSGWSPAAQATTVARQDVILTAGWQDVALDFPSYAAMAAMGNPCIATTMDPAAPQAVGYIATTYTARAWRAEERDSADTWLNPLPFHRDLGLLNQNASPNAFRNSDHPALYGPTPTRLTSAVPTPDTDDFFGGSTLETFTLNPGDGVTAPATRLEDVGDTLLGGTNVPLVPPVGVWFEWYIEPGTTGLPADGELAGFLEAQGLAQIVYDDVTSDPNGALGNADTGQAWTTAGPATWTKSGGRILTNSDGEGLALINSGRSPNPATPLRSEVVLAPGNDGVTVGHDWSLVFRAIDDTEYLKVLEEAGTWYIAKNHLGSFNIVKSLVRPNAVPGDVIAVVDDGTNITVWHNSVHLAGLDYTDTDLNTTTRQGVACPNNNTGFNKFKVSQGNGSVHTYGPIPLARRPWSKGPTRNQSTGGDFYDGRVMVNLASEGYLDFVPRIVVVGSRQLNFNATRASLVQEQPRCEGLRFFVPRRTFGALGFTDSAFEIIPDITTLWPSPGTLLYLKRHVIFDWSFGSLDNTNGAGNHGYYPALWQSGPYGSASDGGFFCDVGRADPGNGTFYIVISVGKTAPGYKNWQIRIDGCSQALAAAQWLSGIAFDMVVATKDWAPVALGMGLGTGTGITWLRHGDTFLGGTVAFFSAPTGLDFVFNSGDVNGTGGHMGIAADLDRTRQTNGFEQVLCAANTFDPLTVTSDVDLYVATQLGPRLDYR